MTDLDKALIEFAKNVIALSTQHNMVTYAELGQSVDNLINERFEVFSKELEIKVKE
jgi:hypothetical protein